MADTQAMPATGISMSQIRRLHLVREEESSADHCVIRRLLSLHHLQQAVDLGIAVLPGTIYGRTTVDRNAAIQSVQRATMAPDGALFGAFRGEEITAAIAVQVSAYFWASQRTGQRYASDLFFVSRRAGDGLRVLRAAVDWAFKQPRVVECTFGVSSGANQGRHDALYARVGAKRIGEMYMVTK